jgi:hypothetical protein
MGAPPVRFSLVLAKTKPASVAGFSFIPLSTYFFLLCVPLCLLVFFVVQDFEFLCVLCVLCGSN